MRSRNILIFVLAILALSNFALSQDNKQSQKQPAISDEVLQYLKEQGIDINAPVEPMLATSVKDADITADYAASMGGFLHIEKYNNFESSMEFIEQRDADVRFYNEKGLHGIIYRVWLIGNSYYNESTGNVDISEISDYLSDASRISDYIMVNCSHLGVVRGWEVSEEEKIERLAKILITLKENFPKIKYIEATNEPDYANEGVTPENYYTYYTIYYKAVNKANAILKPEIPLLVGGPAVSQFSLEWLRPFFDAYVEDPSPNKRIDFISYHGYYTKPDSVYILFKDNPSLVKDQYKILNKELASRDMRADIPVFITEMGMYPGPAFDDFVSIKNDHLRQAAGMASLFYWYLTTSDNIYPFNWVTRHRKEGRKDQLVTRDEKQQPFIHTDKFTPYGNMMLMMSKMKDIRVSCGSSTPISEGKGLYSLAAKDSTGISIMVWNYQGKQSVGYDAALKVDNLPDEWKNQNIQVKRYSIDGETSNYHAGLENCNLQMIEEKAVETDTFYHDSLHLEPNTLQLVTLEVANSNR